MFIVSGANWKKHSASTIHIAKDAKEELEEREPGSTLSIEEAAVDEYHLYDPGGCIFTGDGWTTFNLDNSNLIVRNQHLPSLQAKINKTTKIRGRNTSYYKIKCAYSCICLTILEFHKLRELVKNELEALEQASKNKKMCS